MLGAVGFLMKGTAISLSFPCLTAGTGGKCPHELEAAAAAAQAAAQRAEVEAATAASLSGIPGAEAPWSDVHPFMEAVRNDIRIGALTSWRENGQLRFKTVDQVANSWMKSNAFTQQQKLIISLFRVDFRFAMSS